MPLLPLFGCPWGHEKKWQNWPTGHFCHFFCPSETLKKSGKSGQLAIFATFLPVGTRKKVAKVANWPFLPLFFCPSKILKKDRNTKDLSAKATKSTPIDPSADLDCDLCGQSLGLKPEDDVDTMQRKKNHYVQSCPAIPGRPVILSSEKTSLESVRRMAELGVVKRLGKVVRNNDRVRINSSSVFMSTRRDHIVSLKEEPPDERRRIVARSGR